MDEDTLKLEFKKQVSSLLDEISKFDTDLASIINDKYTILSDEHIEEFNNNISPYINEIIVQNSTIFEEDEIELFEDISLSNLWEKLSDDDKVIIFKYLQTIYLISNVYNRDNQSKEIHKMMKQIKSSIKEFDNLDSKTDSDTLDDVSDENNLNDNNLDNNTNENNTIENITETKKSSKQKQKQKHKSKQNQQPDINNMMKGLEGMFGNGGGDNNILKMAMEMSQEIMSDPNFSIDKIMKGDGNSLTNMMGNISEKIDTKYKNGELDKEKIEKDASNFMGNMKNNPMFNNLMNQMNNMNHKQKRKATRKMNKKNKE